jgi:altronate dehydratase small subunit
MRVLGPVMTEAGIRSGIMDHRCPVEIGSDARLLFVDPKDNVCTVTRAIESGTPIQISGHTVLISQTVPFGFKIAACKIALDDKVIKYGVPIGSATRDIATGEIVHVHNMKSDYLPTYTLDPKDRP